jgi:hypothetical protein
MRDVGVRDAGIIDFEEPHGWSIDAKVEYVYFGVEGVYNELGK